MSKKFVFYNLKKIFQNIILNFTIIIIKKYIYKFLPYNHFLRIVFHVPDIFETNKNNTFLYACCIHL